MHSVVCAYIKFPAVQKKLQAEIDAVVGRERMPNVHDLPQLSYTRAFVREALRWRSVARFSLPHATSEADAYKGFYIPKGATIIGNAWCMEHDPNFFPDHETVRPERYLTADGSALNDAPVFGFGFGRRICPGQAMALTSMALATACLMWAFDFTKAKDASGRILEPDASPENCHDGGNVFRINPFPYAVTPRKDVGNVEQMVRSTVKATF
jgi:cytochrome P450